MIGSEHAMADGRAGLMQFPFWMWTHSAGVGQEYIDHYYWAIATAGNKLFADFAEESEDRMAGWSIITKTVEDLAGGYHPNLKKLIGPSSRTTDEHLQGQQDGLYHILHVLSPKGTLSDIDTGVLPAISNPDNPKRAVSTLGHDYPPETVALHSLSGPWGDPWISELIDEKPFPWSAIMEKKVVSEGDWVTTWFGENYGLVSIRATPGQRMHVLGHWRRQAKRPDTMREIGMIDVRVGFNESRFANDDAGILTSYGIYHNFQYQNKLIMLARPNLKALKAALGKKDTGEIHSVQCSAALFSHELPGPSWKIFVDGKKIESLPVSVRRDQVVTIHDGVSYLALRALPTDAAGATDLGLSLRVGKPQIPAYHADTRITPTLMIDAFLAKQDAPMTMEDLDKLATAQTGFVVEMGDEKEYGSFAKFQAHIQQAKLTANTNATSTVTYASSGDQLVASWNNGFTVNGASPYPIPEQGIWRDTTLTQMGKGRLEKSGAVIEREMSKNVMLLQTFPKQKIYVAMNLLPNYLDYSFTEPGGVKIIADGACSMGRWAVKDSRQIDIKYQAYGAPYAPEEKDPAPARVLFITGAKGKPQVTLNGQDVSGSLKVWKQGEVDGWLVSLTGTMPNDEELASRLAK
jgi:hypothetical protein